MSRFVSPVEVRLVLSNGDYLIVKEYLNHGDEQDLQARMRRDNERNEIDPLLYPDAFITAYLLDWSLTDDGGRIVPVRDQDAATVAAALRNLYGDEYREIYDAIEAHEKQAKAARQEKKTNAGAPASDRTWPSRVAAAGVTNG